MRKLATITAIGALVALGIATPANADHQRKWRCESVSLHSPSNDPAYRSISMNGTGCTGRTGLFFTDNFVTETTTGRSWACNTVQSGAEDGGPGAGMVFAQNCKEREA